MRATLIRALAVCLCLLGNAYADTGLNWLTSQAQSDGSVARTTDIATPIQSTSEALKAFVSAGVTSGSPVTAGLQYLGSQTYLNTENLSRLIVSGVAAGQDVSVAVSKLLANQDAATGGFGELPGYQPTILDTAFAIEALATVGNLTSQNSNIAIAYLQGQQASDGSWQDNNNGPSVYLTALTTAAINKFSGAFNVTQIVKNGANYLLSARQSDGLWNEDFLSAESLITLLQTLPIQPAISNGLQALSGHQSADGSWGGDVYTTALVIRTLGLAAARGASAGNGAVEGHVSVAGSNRPISGATVSIPAFTGFSVQTNADGYFVISGLPAGNVTLVASAAGYGSSSIAALVSAGQTATANFVLAASAQTSSVSVHLFDATTNSAVSGAAVTLTGAATYSASTDSNGNAVFGAITPGAYNIAINASGYATVNGSFAASGGQPITMNQPMIKGVVNSSSPTSVIARIIDGTSNAAVANAQLDLGGGLVAISDSSGSVTLSNVSPGSYTATVSANGYAQQTYSLVVSGGATNNFGALSIYQIANTTPSTAVTLLGTVIDGLSNKPVAGTTISVDGVSAATTTDAAGHFTVAGISSLTFTVHLSAPGYSATAYTVTASAYGSVSSTFSLPPASGGGVTINLQGHVTDADTQAAISGATLSVVRGSATAVSDADGSYQFTNLASGNFALQVIAPGYGSQTFNVNLTASGTYVLDVALQAAATASGLQVLSVSTTDNGKGANQAQTFTAKIANNSSSPGEGLIVGYVLDPSGQQIGKVIPFAPSTRVLQSDFTFASNETKTLQIEWNPMQVAPGAYTLQLDVVKPGSITGPNPKGTVWAEQLAYTNVSALSSITGTLAINPPLAQAGGTAPVDLQVLVVNSGNVPLNGTNLTLAVTPPGGGSALLTRTASVASLDVGGFTYVSFGQWVPTQNGNLGVVVASADSGTQGQVTGALYVGDKPQGAFTVTPNNVFVGTQTVHATVNVSGVDNTIGVSSPLVFAVRNSVQKGINYIAPAVVSAQNTSHCNRCHVQTQSYYGLAGVLGHDVGSDPATTQFVHNVLATDQIDSGIFFDAYKNERPQATEVTGLNMWALTQDPDKIGSFPILYKASRYMQSIVKTSGNTAYWVPDYVVSPYTQGFSWFGTNDAETMMVEKAMVEVLTTARNNDVSNIPDYSGSASLASLGGTVLGMKAGPDGALYAVVQSTKTIVRYDPSAGTTSTVATALPANCTSLLPVAANEFYVVCPSQLIHVLPDGTHPVVGAIGSQVYDIVQGADGTIYISDPANKRILRGPPSGPFVPYVSGGLITSPAGLAIGPDGSLFIANNTSYNVLKVASGGTVSVAVSGFMYPPTWLAIQADGSMYASHPQYADPTTGQTTTDGLMRIDNQGFARRLFSLSGVRSLALYNGQLFMGTTSGSLRQLVISPLDISGLSSLTSTVTSIANRYLSEYHDNSADNIIQAVRLIGLGEARQVLTDPQILSNIDAAMATINTLLRARQKTDGGWAWGSASSHFTTSDAMVTALVGTALDYVSPQANDPVIVNAVQFLVNGQNADGSWKSNDGIMATAFAATGLVMAYLPHELDRIGGLSVELHLTFPSTSTLTNVSQAPSGTLPSGNGGTAYTWQLPGVTSQGRSITFDLSLANLLPGETRPAASAAYMLSTNSFDGSQLRVDLTIPSVHATDGLTLVSLATDHPSYAAGQTVQISAPVQNVAPVAQSGSVVFTIRSSADQSVVTTLPAVPFSNLAAGQTGPISAVWPIGSTLAGNYSVTADLYDSSGTLADEKIAPLAVTVTSGTDTGATDPNASVSLRVTTDKQIYTTTDRVNIGDLVRNLTVNGVIDNASLQVQVVNPSGVIVYSQTHALGQLSIGYLRQLADLYGFSASAQGSYTVNGWVLDGSGGILASSSATYTVTENLAATVKGAETVQSPWVYQGDPQTCTDVVTNNGTQSLNSLSIHQVLVNLDTGVLDQEAFVTANLVPGASKTFTRVFSTNGLSLGHHACAIEAQVNGSYKPLANAPFEVRQPPVRVSGNFGLGDKGRLLVLMDGPTDGGSGGALCNSGLGDVSMEVDFDHGLSPDAIVEVKVLNFLGLIVDTETTSLRSFTGEVNAKVGNGGIDLSIPAFTTDSLVFQLAGNGASHLLSGTYTVVATVTDPVKNLTFNSGLISLTCNVLGTVGDVVGGVFRVIGVNVNTHPSTGPGDGVDSTSATQQKSTLQALLAQDGWSYDISTNRTDFATKLRTGNYQNFALLSEYQVLDEQIQKEVRENVFGGAGLLNAGRHDVRRRILDNPLGIEYRGTQLSPVGLQMLTGNVFGLNGQSSFTQNNQVQRVVLQGASVDGNVISGIPTTQQTLVTHYHYGNGLSAYAGFDLLAETSAGSQTGLFANLIRQPLIYANPSQSTPVAGRVVPTRLSVTNTGIANTTVATISTSLGSYVTAANAGTVSGGKLTWTFNLGVNETKTVDLWIQLPPGGLPVTLTAKLVASSGNFTANPVTVSYAVNPVTRPALDEAITALTTYVNNQPPPGLLGWLLDPILGIKTPAAQALIDLKAANQDLINGNVQRALTELVRATDYLINDGSTTLKPIRLEVDEAIFQTQKLQ